jgi:hypothetical protein
VVRGAVSCDHGARRGRSATVVWWLRWLVPAVGVRADAGDPRARRSASLLRPRRIRCGGCRVTHVVLASVFVPRRADSAHVILAALLAKAGGRGHRAVAADLSLPPDTVRGWLRRASTNAEQVRVAATQLAVVADPLIGPIDPTGTALGDALEGPRPRRGRRAPAAGPSRRADRAGDDHRLPVPRSTAIMINNAERGTTLP